ncbi:MAG: oligopeptide transporter, OPT family, partial [Fuerstiella sp.]|nr:oligopeptide transporter, OPT family [Fuerstiella sp.]
MSDSNPEPALANAARQAELTLPAVLLGIGLSVVMGAANVYLGLRAGMTVSASIPAAVISMGILRGIMRRGSVLESNLVQTCASAGESLAAGIIFTMPALLLTGVWQEFDFWMTTLIAL